MSHYQGAKTRRDLLKGMGAMAAIPFAATSACATTPSPRGRLPQIAKRFPTLYPQFRTALEVLAEVGEAFTIGEGPTGVRRVVPIIGGEFRGPGLSGVVLSGGADRQTIRADGIRELDATYELRADDGTHLMIRNRALIDAQTPPEGENRYVRSVVNVTAPRGEHDWLNRRVILGTLHSLRPQEPLVFLRFHIFE